MDLAHGAGDHSGRECPAHCDEWLGALLALLIGGGLLGLAFFSLYATIERGQSGFRRARFMLDALAYGSALLLFLFVYQTRTCSLLSGTLIAMTAVLLAVEILRSTTNQPRPLN